MTNFTRVRRVLLYEPSRWRSPHSLHSPLLCLSSRLPPGQAQTHHALHSVVVHKGRASDSERHAQPR
eukprot:1539822-Pleurochrysis_carterae.AAC.2